MLISQHSLEVVCYHQRSALQRGTSSFKLVINVTTWFPLEGTPSQFQYLLLKNSLRIPRKLSILSQTIRTEHIGTQNLSYEITTRKFFSRKFFTELEWCICHVWRATIPLWWQMETVTSPFLEVPLPQRIYSLQVLHQLVVLTLARLFMHIWLSTTGDVSAENTTAYGPGLTKGATYIGNTFFVEARDKCGNLGSVSEEDIIIGNMLFIKLFPFHLVT